MFNANTVATLSFNQSNAGHSDQQAQDETMFEQLYQFQQNYDRIPIPSTARSS
jgi:hypothetical protein